MSKQAMPWVRFFPSDWLGGTRGLSASEAGIYINLIAMMYERGEPLAEDTPRLARLCGASNAVFKAALARLVDDGKIVRLDAGLWNDRVAKEQVYRSEKSTVGKQAAEKRWQKNQQNQHEDDANAMRTQCVGNADSEAQKPEDSSSNSENIINVVIPAGAGIVTDDRYAFCGETIRLTARDLENWRRSFPHLSLEAELWALDPWATQQESTGKKWFHAVSNALAKKERTVMAHIHMASLPKAMDRRLAPDPRI